MKEESDKLKQKETELDWNSTTAFDNEMAII